MKRNRAPLLKMYRIFTFTTFIVIAAGAVNDNGGINVKRGGNFSLFVSTSELKKATLRKVQKNGTQEIFRYCSPEEQELGCKPSDSGRFSLQIDKEKVSITCFDADTSDEGVYIVGAVDKQNNWIQRDYTVSLTTDEPPSSINPEPPSIRPFTTPAISTKGKETFMTKGPNTTVSTEPNDNIRWDIIGSSLSAVIAVAVAVIVIIYCKKKKKNNHIAKNNEDPGQDIPLNSDTNRVGEPATDESLEIVVETNSSVDFKEGRMHGA